MSSRSVFALATFALVISARPASAYRTSGDVLGLSEHGAVTWADGLQFHLDLSAFRIEERGGVREAVLRAAARWSSVECASATVDFVGSTVGVRTDDGLNTIIWVDDWSERGFESTAMATTDVQYMERPDGTYEIVEADILLNRRGFRWTSLMSATEAEGVRSIEAVITHELGHALGLSHSCGEPGAPDCSEPVFGEATMSPHYRGIQQASLEADDIEGVCALYPGERTTCAADTECAPYERCTGTCVPACDVVSCDEGFMCSAGRCLREPCEDCPACEEAADCAGGRCVAGVCVAGLELGEPCGMGGECASTQCTEGICARTCECAVCDDSGRCCEEGTCAALFGQPCDGGDECASRRVTPVSRGNTWWRGHLHALVR